MINIFASFIWLSMLAIPILTQNHISLLIDEKLKDYLSLDPHQFKIISLIVEQIINILKEDKIIMQT